MRILFVAALLVAASQLTTTVSAQSICGNVIPPTNSTKVCIEKSEPCTFNATGCCAGLICTGFTFYKSCKEPPTCLEEWHDCAANPICCNGLVCGQGKEGTWECRKPEIGIPTTTVPIPPGGLVKNTNPPTAAPTTANNTKTTKIPYNKTDVACATGDPHIYTFDGYKYDCQGEGEHILLASRITQRQVQSYMMHYADNKAVSVIKGVAIQDEGDTPLVELSIPKYNDTVANDFGRPGCRILLFVDGIQRDLYKGSGTSKVRITPSGSSIEVLYNESGFKVTVGMGLWHTCLLNVCTHVPRTDPTIYGILGTPNGNTADDWTLPNGSIMPLAAGAKSALSREGYNFCVPNYCNQDESKSLFGHQEYGVTFAMRNQCLLPFGVTWEQYLAKVPQEIIDICGDDLACIMDGMNAGPNGARDFRNSRLALLGTCSNIGGSCDAKQCCPGLNCVDQGFGGMLCVDQPLVCSQELADCRNIRCCGILQCNKKDDGRFMCENTACRPEWQSCSADADCCKGLSCISNGKGGMQCRKLPTCMPVYDDCTRVGCCGNLKCLPIPGGKRCDPTPDCWNTENTDCSVAPCCPGLGLACVQSRGRSLCTKVPACVNEGQVCTYSPCCQTTAKPMSCSNVTDSRGNSAMMCRMWPSNVRIRVFDDTNANGQFDAGEPGIPNVQLRLVYAKDNTVVLDQRNGGNAHQELRTDATGFVVFRNVPQGSMLKVRVTRGPFGGVATVAQQAGVPAAINSDLLSDGMTDAFIMDGSVQDYNQTMIGYLMPTDLKITVWGDDNANGIFDANERGVSGVQLRLVTNADKRFLLDNGSGGSSAAPLFTDDDGTVTFTKVTNMIELAVMVTLAPIGGVPTTLGVGSDKSKSSALQTSGQFSTPFTLTRGSGSVEDTIKLGYRMPQMAIVRVWDDANNNGIQDVGEIGIPNVALRLIRDSDLSFLPNQNNGGNAHLELRTDLNGIVMFTMTPAGLRLRVRVTSPPSGALPATSKQGTNPNLDSDLVGNNMTDTFTMPIGTYSSTDIGYRMLNNVLIRVWDDVNGNGLQDSGESGIPNVALRLILASDGSNLPDQRNGGSAHQELFTTSDGTVTFSQVPRSIAMRAMVTNAPIGALIALKDVGANSNIDSDLGSDMRSDPFTLNSGGPPTFSDISLGFRMPLNMTVRVWDDANGNGIQDTGELGINNVWLRLVLDRDLTNLPDPRNGGNSGNQVNTDANGIATFTMVPKGVRLRVRVVNAPQGAIRTTVATASAAGVCGTPPRQTFGSVSNGAGFYSSLPIVVTQQTESSVSFMVNQNWKSGSSVGWIAVDYPIAGSRTCQRSSNVATSTTSYTAICGSDYKATVNVYVFDSTFTSVPNNVDGSIPTYCNPTADAGRKVAFSFDITCKCPKMVAMPDGTTQIVTEGADSDLLDDGTSTSFDLGDFGGAIFNQIALGYRMPTDVRVRVWDDINGDGLQTDGEPGISGVLLRLQLAVDGSQCPPGGVGSSANSVQRTDADGFATFVKVPKGLDLRVWVQNRPAGAITTSQNVGLERGKSSSLRPDGTSEIFNLNSFIGKSFEDLDLGYRMPANMVVRVWEDINNNGRQDPGEPGIARVALRLITDSDKKNLLPIGGSGSNAANLINTDANGTVTFFQVPKGVDLRVLVTNAPPGSIPTTLGGQSGYTDQGYSVVFNLGSFTTAGAFTGINLGFKMPKDTVIRVWNDLNRNGIMDSNEPGIPNVFLRLVVPSTGANLPDPGTGGTAASEIQTDATGRAIFTRVPQGIDLRVRITRGLPTGASPTLKNQGTNRQVDSDGNADGTSDTFRIAPDTTALYDLISLGYTFGTGVTTRSTNLRGCDTTAESLGGSICEGSGMYSENPMEIVSQTAETVTFHINNNWIKGGAVDWIGADFNGISGDICSTSTNVAANTVDYTAVCSDGVAQVDVYAYDGSFKVEYDISGDIPVRCSAPTGGKVRFSYNLPCCGA